MNGEQFEIFVPINPVRVLDDPIDLYPDMSATCSPIRRLAKDAIFNLGESSIRDFIPIRRLVNDELFNRGESSIHKGIERFRATTTDGVTGFVSSNVKVCRIQCVRNLKKMKVYPFPRTDLVSQATAPRNTKMVLTNTVQNAEGVWFKARDMSGAKGFIRKSMWIREIPAVRFKSRKELVLTIFTVAVYVTIATVFASNTGIAWPALLIYLYGIYRIRKARRLPRVLKETDEIFVARNFYLLSENSLWKDPHDINVVEVEPVRIPEVPIAKRICKNCRYYKRKEGSCSKIKTFVHKDKGKFETDCNHRLFMPQYVEADLSNMDAWREVIELRASPAEPAKETP